MPKIDDAYKVFGTMDHLTNECLTILAFKDVLHDQENAMNMVKNHTLPPIQRHKIKGGGTTQIFLW